MHFCEFTTPQVINITYIKTKKKIMRIHKGFRFTRLLRACFIALFLGMYIQLAYFHSNCSVLGRFFFFIEIVLAWTKSRPNHYDLTKDYYIDGQNTQLIFLEKIQLWEGKRPPQITHRGWIFWTMIFYNLEKFTLRSI